jgi:4-hydroxythreonine-4-phosphate dehydrogenase
MTTSTDRPILALTMGDPVGVGPEIIVKALADAQIYQVCRPLVLGDLSALDRARQALDPALKIHLADRPAAGRYEHGTLDLCPCQLGPQTCVGRPPRRGRPWWAASSPPLIRPRPNMGGAFTAPISKISMTIGLRLSGHTEPAESNRGFAMMLAGEPG